MSTAGSIAHGLVPGSTKQGQTSGKKKSGIAALMVAAAGAGVAVLRRRGKHDKDSTASARPQTTDGSTVNTGPADVPRP